MSLNFKKLEVEDIAQLNPYFCKRPNKTCDSVFLDSFLWREYYQVQFAISEERAIQLLMMESGKPSSAMPVCKQEDLPKYFEELKQYFNEELKAPLRIYLADEEAVEYLNLKDSNEFEVTEQEDLKDYLYDGDAMRALSGRKLHKKKNHLNGFLKAYEGRYEYRVLCCTDRDDVWRYLDSWREQKGEEVEEHLDYEVAGIHEILKNCSYFTVRMAGVFIDDKLEAFTIGSYNSLEDMAVIHIEKANPMIRGLYQFINQQFLLHEFPTVKFVNREDDLGEEGLRKAKLSYNPMGYARKYKVVQKW